MTRSTPNSPPLRLRETASHVALTFEFQAIVDAGGTLFAREILFRGTHPRNWMPIDMFVLKQLTRNLAPFPRLFINLSNDTLLRVPEQLLLSVAAVNDVYFELNEAVLALPDFEILAQKVNRLIRSGLRFAIDDFGSGLDGVKRLCALDRVDCVKLDVDILRSAMARSNARTIIRDLVRHWRSANILVIAEGVESQDMMSFAVDLGVDFVQGFHVDKLPNSHPTKFCFRPQEVPASEPIAFAVFAG